MRLSKETILIATLATLKLLLHFFTNTNYGLHRDEYLYFDQGKHLAWGFYEVPPITPLIGKFAGMLGGSVFAIRLFPAIAGAIIIVLACKLVKDLGGKQWAIAFTGISLLLTTPLLASNTLFQPVTFNQLFWFLIAYKVVQIIRKQQKIDYYTLGVFMGVGILTKYSVLFYLVAILAGVLITKQRTLLFNRHFLSAVIMALVIATPNIFWQINHDLPVLQHMKELSESQLVHMNWGVFLRAQIIAHKGFTLMWIIGLIGLFTFDQLKSYRSLGFAFLFTLLIIGLLSGKSYYTLGAFLILFPFAGLTADHFLKSFIAKIGLLLVMFLITLPFLPYALPILKIEKLKIYSKYLADSYRIDYMLRWEDGKYYELPQDQADMFGWEEISQKVAKIYHSLPAEEQRNCMLYGGSYSHAGSLNYYRKKYKLPEAYSFNGSYTFWADESVKFDNQIVVDDVKQENSPYFSEVILVDSVENPYAREKGYIYQFKNPTTNVSEVWKRIVLERRGY